MCWVRATTAKVCLAEAEARALPSMWDLLFRIVSLEVEKLVTVWDQADSLCPGAYSSSSWSGAAFHDAELNGRILSSSHSTHHHLLLLKWAAMPQGLLLWSVQRSSLGNIVLLRSPRSFLHNLHHSFRLCQPSQERFLTFPSLWGFLHDTAEKPVFWMQFPRSVLHLTPCRFRKNEVALTFDLRWLLSLLRPWSLEQQRHCGYSEGESRDKETTSKNSQGIRTALATWKAT